MQTPAPKRPYKKPILMPRGKLQALTGDTDATGLTIDTETPV